MFEVPDVDLVVHDLVDGYTRYIDHYLKIFRDLFPQYIRYEPVMRQRAEARLDRSANELWHQWLLMVGGKPAGIVGFLYNQGRNVGLLMDFAIYPFARKIQVGGKIPFSLFALNLSMQQLTNDARQNGLAAPICLAAEVEYPALVKKYLDYGYVEFPVEYYEPPTTPELEKVGDKIQELTSVDFKKLHVGAFPIPGQSIDLNAPEVIKSVLLAFLEDHYQLASTHWLVQKVVHKIPV